MKVNYALLVLAAIALPAFTMTTGEQETAPLRLTPYVTLTGAKSKIQKTEYRYLRTQEELINVWRQHLGAPGKGKYSMHYNQLQVPKVDFKKCRIIAIFQGTGMNSAGLKAISMTEEKNRVLFRFDDKSFQTMSKGTRVTPFAFFVIPYISKRVVLEENIQGIIGAPPIWKERISFPHKRPK